VYGFDYYTIALITVSFCGAGKGDCPRWTIKFKRWKASNFFESIILFHRGWQSVFFFFSKFNSTDDNYAFAEWWAGQYQLARKC
jgi:hypothetical protein